MPLSTLDSTVDLRPVAPSEQADRLMNAFVGLGVGGTLEFVADQSPAAWREQLQTRWPERFVWQDVQGGPDLWVVRLVKTSGSCCGACSGA